jgi:hypothetical protein
MRSRSYFGIASLFLFASACLAAPKEDARQAVEDVLPEAKAPLPKDKIVFEVPVEGYAMMPDPMPVPVPEATDTSSSGCGEDTEDEIPSDLPMRSDGCLEGEMLIDGTCSSKEKIAVEQEAKDETAKKRYKKSKRPAEKAKAAHDILEQQVVQMDRTLDDLDEIQEIIESKKKEGKL